MIMRVITTKRMKPAVYLLFAWLGRRIYSLRLKLEQLNDWVDLKAGEYWGEE